MSKLKVKIAHIRDNRSVVRGGGGFGIFGEELPHFLLGLEVKFAAFKFHAVRVVDGFAHLYAHQNVLIARILFFQIMRVVSQNKGNARFAVKFYLSLGGNSLLEYSVGLKLEIETVLPEKLR